MSLADENPAASLTREPARFPREFRGVNDKSFGSVAALNLDLPRGRGTGSRYVMELTAFP